MKFRNLLLMGTVVACGLTLASCGETKATVGLGYSGEFVVSDLKDGDTVVTANGSAQLDLTSAFVAFDSKGKVVDARLDVVQVKVKSTKAEGAEKAGLELTNKNVVEGSVTSKLELGKDYGMVQFGNSIAEVDAQIEAFADWTVGKTVEEIKAGVKADHGYGVAPSEDLASSVTIVCHSFVSAIESAWANRTETTYKLAKDAKAGIAMVSTLAYNYGNPQTDISVDVAGVMVAGGKVVASQVDAVVFQTSVDAATLAIAPLAGSKYMVDGVLTSKKSLGAAYAMAEVNGGQEGCTKEWFEQAAIIEAAAMGKTSAEIATLVKDTGDLAGATITLDSYVKALAKATTYAEKEHVGPQA